MTEIFLETSFCKLSFIYSRDVKLKFKGSICILVKGVINNIFVSINVTNLNGDL